MTGTGARFHLLLAEQPTGFDLMAECALCGAMTEQPLSVVWDATRPLFELRLCNATRCHRPRETKRASCCRASDDRRVELDRLYRAWKRREVRRDRGDDALETAEPTEI